MKNLGFKMPHMGKSEGLSPLSAGVPGEMKGISPSEYLSRRAIEKEKDLYLQKPGGEDEFNREITEKYVTGYPDYKIKNIPTDDAEQPIQGWRDNKEDWQFAPDRISSKKETRYSTRIK